MILDDLRKRIKDNEPKITQKLIASKLKKATRNYYDQPKVSRMLNNEGSISLKDLRIICNFINCKLIIKIIDYKAKI